MVSYSHYVDVPGDKTDYFRHYHDIIVVFRCRGPNIGQELK